MGKDRGLAILVGIMFVASILTLFIAIGATGNPIHSCTADHDPHCYYQWFWWWPAADGWVAIFTCLLFISTFALWQVTRSAVQETRRIGEAQVRAYVSVPKAGLQFIDMGVGAQPQIAVSLKNTGLTPARKIGWNPTLRYASGTRRRTRSLVDQATPGKWARTQEIAAQGEIFDQAIMAHMMIKQFVPVPDAMPFGCTIVLKVEFVFIDVFDQEVRGEAYFLGLAQHIAADQVGNSEGWHAFLRASPKPNDWDYPDSE